MVGMIFNDLYKFHSRVDELKRRDQAPSKEDVKNLVESFLTKYALPVTLGYYLVRRFKTNDPQGAWTLIFSVFISNVLRSKILGDYLWLGKRSLRGMWDWVRGAEKEKEFIPVHHT